MTETTTTKPGARTQLQFIQLSRAWYAEANLLNRDFVDDIIFGIYHEDGGCECEGAVRWYPLDHRKMPSAQLEIFEDGWKLLGIPGLADALANAHNTNPSPEEFCDILKAIGFTDATLETR